MATFQAQASVCISSGLWRLREGLTLKDDYTTATVRSLLCFHVKLIGRGHLKGLRRERPNYTLFHGPSCSLCFGFRPSPYIAQYPYSTFATDRRTNGWMLSSRTAIDRWLISIHNWLLHMPSCFFLIENNVRRFWPIFLLIMVERTSTQTSTSAGIFAWCMPSYSLAVRRI